MKWIKNFFVCTVAGRIAASWFLTIGLGILPNVISSLAIRQDRVVWDALWNWWTVAYVIIAFMFVWYELLKFSYETDPKRVYRTRLRDDTYNVTLQVVNQHISQGNMTKAVAAMEKLDEFFNPPP